MGGVLNDDGDLVWGSIWSVVGMKESNKAEILVDREAKSEFDYVF